jgi:hypothetical protein
VLKALRLFGIVMILILAIFVTLSEHVLAHRDLGMPTERAREQTCTAMALCALGYLAWV